ncbi:nucleotide-binding alpha-beta plait domain-containing protein [Tanacetum coccineum]
MDEWTEVRRRGHRNKSWNADFARATQDKTVTFFFTRFPDSWDEKALWELFRKYGSVMDVYLAVRRTKLGTRFGFVRFARVLNVEKFEKHLKGIIIGETKMVISPNTISKESNDPVNVCSERSFKDVTAGIQRVTEEQMKTKKREEVIDAQINLSHVAQLKRCWSGEARNIHALRNIWTLFKQGGLGACVIHYLGGLSFLYEWSSEKVVAESLELNKVNLGMWFSKLKIWEHDLEPTGRLTSLEIEGLPATAWDVENVQKLGDKFGTILEIDNMEPNGAIRSSVGVLILTRSMEEISSCVPVKVNNHIYHTRVVEDHNRSFLLILPVDSEYGSSDDDSDEDLEGIPETKLGRKEGMGNTNDGSRKSDGNEKFHASAHADFPIFDNKVDDSNDRGSHNNKANSQYFNSLENDIDDTNVSLGQLNLEAESNSRYHGPNIELNANEPNLEIPL